jgi:hypothetical protein
MGVSQSSSGSSLAVKRKAAKAVRWLFGCKLLCIAARIGEQCPFVLVVLLPVLRIHELCNVASRNLRSAGRMMAARSGARAKQGQHGCPRYFAVFQGYSKSGGFGGGTSTSLLVAVLPALSFARTVTRRTL